MANPNSTCSVENCEKTVDRKGWCSKHYSSWKRHGDPLATSYATCQKCGDKFKRTGTTGVPPRNCPECRPRPRTECPTCGGPLPRSTRSDGTLAPAPKYCSDECKPRCSVDGCDLPLRKRGYCANHYAMWHAHGEIRDWKFKWADEKLCVVCGAKDWPDNGKRKHCSASCQAADSRHQTGATKPPRAVRGDRPKSVPCILCGDDIPLGRRDGRLQRTDIIYCRSCRRESPEARRFVKYGVRPEEYSAALECGCEICGKIVPALDVDHDHDCCPANKKSCGQCVRGFLCGDCNRALGLFRDDVESLKKAVAYLTR